MRIKQLLTLVFSLFIIPLSAQSYSLTTSTGTYEHLEESISLNKGLMWDDPQFAIPIGFDFQYGGITFQEIFLEDFGLGGLLASDTSEMGVIPIIVPFGADIIDRGYDLLSDTASSQSNISYKQIGTEGSKILQIEWNNVGFFEDLGENNIATDFTNFQLWLYEGTNDIEVHFGPTSILNPELAYEGETGAYIGLYPAYDTEKDSLTSTAYMLAGDPATPNLKAINDFEDTPFLMGTIPEGTIYRFSAVTTSLKDAVALPIFSIAPNPAQNVIRLISEEALTSVHQIQIVRIDGQIVKQCQLNKRELDISDLNTGLYGVQLISETGESVMKKFLKH